MKKVKNLLLSVALLLGVVAAPLVTATAAYADDQNVAAACEGVKSISGDSDCKSGGFTNFLQKIINLLLFLIGAIAVIVIIVAGIRYVVSGGDQGQITGAKNTILYAVVGLVVALMAFAIVNWVLFAVKN